MAKKSQVEKFREAARAVETDDDEDRFNESLRRVAKAKPPKSDSAPDPEKVKKALDEGDMKTLARELGQTEEDVWHKDGKKP